MYTPAKSEINEIVPGLYLSSYGGASNIDYLKRIGITDIINLSDKENVAPTEFNYHRIQIADDPDADIKQYFAITNSIIDSVLETGGKVLVHCTAGVSRSPTIILAYLMVKNGYYMEEAFNFVYEKRRVIHPNEGFIQQLEQYTNEINR